MSDKVFISESGKFICDDDNIVQSFVPCDENIIGEKNYKHLIIPEGVIGFCSGFGSGITVTEKFLLPETLREIGSEFNKRENVFARAKLTTVIIPEAVQLMGIWAFGKSEIDVLCLPMKYMGKFPQYMRQFKDAKINKLYVHEYKLDEKDVQSYFRIDSYDINEVYYYQTKENGCLPTSFILA